jgi:hypothetical protein
MYFLNLPCVDVAHGYIFSKLRRTYVFWNNLFRHQDLSDVAHAYWQHEGEGLPLTDLLLKLHPFLQPTIYYFDVKASDKQLDFKTHLVLKQQDVESYPVRLQTAYANNQAASVQKPVEFIASDISLCTHHNLIMADDDWFEIEANQEAKAEFSQRFRQPVTIKGLEIRADNLASYQIKWQGSVDGGQSWMQDWVDDYQQLPAVTAVRLKVKFKAGKKRTSVSWFQIKQD